MKIAIIVIILIVLAAIGYLIYFARNSPSIIGNEYDRKLKESKPVTEK